MARLCRPLIVLSAMLLLAALPRPAGAAGDPTVLTLAEAVDKALARDALVGQAKQSRDSARNALIQVRARTPRLSISSDTSSATSGSLDPGSVITGTQYSSQSYSSNLQMPLGDGTSLSLYTAASTSTTNSSLGTGGGQSFTYASAAEGVGLSRPLSVFRNERVLTEGPRWSAEMGLRGAELALESSRRAVIRDTLSYFFAAVRAQRQAQIAEASQREAEELLRIAGEKLKHGRIPEIDVMEAQVSADSARTTVRRQQSAAATALDALKNFLGMPLEQAVQVSHAEAAVAPVSLGEDALVQQAFAQRLDLRQSALSIRSAELSLRQVRAQARPGVFISGGYSRSGQAPTISESYRELINSGWYVGLSTSMSLTRREDRAAIDSARGSLALAQQEAQLQREAIRLEVRRLLREVQDTEANAALLAETVKRAEENLRIRQTQFEHGLVRPIDVMQTERQLEETRLSQADAAIDHQLARANLGLAVGEVPNLRGEQQ